MGADRALQKPNSGIFERMKQKIKYLIGACSIAMLALTAIQAYFIYNTYVLKEKEAESAVRAELIQMEGDLKINFLRKDWMAQFEALVKTNQQAAINAFLANGSQTISRQVTAYINNNPVLRKYHTAYRVTILTASLVNRQAGFEKHIHNLPWFGNASFPGEQVILHDLSNDNSSGNDYIRSFTIRSGFSISKGRNSILAEMTGLLLFSVILLGLVMLLFYFSIRGLITQRKLTDLQTDFINNITHEFNTPLATLAVAIRTLRDQEKGNAIIKSTISIMERQHLRLKKLISQVMTHTANAQQLLLKKEKIAADSFLLHILYDFEAANPGAELKSKIENASIELTIDSFYLTSAVTNILENAVKYGGTRINVTTKVTGDFYQVIIQDNGIGIPMEEQGKIFTKFYRVEKGDVHNTKGLGLGLYFSRQIMIAHGGQIRVDSPAGQGCSFTLFLPVA
ncbi:sensor histidine kinase [Mucilaginibacter sp. SJ]|uniref:sensor histidine kinase n=1 Tax=Mucilaginibacter sp. SJ TaxID=3029053 RepID=UPI0023A9FA99|nr:HAMP domain-containing sensor histidine kinase [Mucilaginibacter sp. SJ]WEA00580.1 HAMP domain-containing sensor histidine kinase [Mucilaginibacter sp. SJ]